jgi:hypothetical protein
MVHNAAEQFQQESRAFRSAAQDLINQTESARDRRLQDRWLIGVGGAGIVLGVLLMLFAPRPFPQTVAPRVASIVCPSSNDLRLFGLWKIGVSGSVCGLI